MKWGVKEVAVAEVAASRSSFPGGPIQPTSSWTRSPWPSSSASSSSFPGGGGVLNSRPRHQGWRLGGVLNSARRGLRTTEARENLGGEGGEKTTPEG